MKNNKKKSPMMKIVSAAAMLAVSASMLGTSTYAWFSMNTVVTVNNMSVTAKSDSTYLLVGDSASTLNSIRTAKSITAAGTQTLDTALYPTAHNSNVTNITTAEATSEGNLSNWWYSYSTDPADDGETDKLVTHDGNETTYSIASGDIGNYILINEFHITTAEGANEMSDLHVKRCTITATGDEAVKVLVAGANGCEEFSGTGGNGVGTSLQTANVKDSELSTVKVYVYWDGQDDEVNTNNIDNLLSTSVSVEFTGTIVNS